jgi:hypothetical protein
MAREVVRTMAIPMSVRQAVDGWTTAAGIEEAAVGCPPKQRRSHSVEIYIWS